MQAIMQTLQPYLDQIVQALLGLLVLMVMAGLNQVKRKATNWLETRTTESQRQLLLTVGREAFTHAETVFKGMGAQQKLDGALDYASQRLTGLGIEVTPAEMRAAVHSAWLDYQAQVKPEALAQPTTSSDMKPF